jgi:hypothetical protein
MIGVPPLLIPSYHEIPICVYEETATLFARFNGAPGVEYKTAPLPIGETLDVPTRFVA